MPEIAVLASPTVFLSSVRNAAVSVRLCSPEGWTPALSVSRSVAA
ncbi:hypothetical protein P0092_19430 [Ruminiclostridium papyrosolvens DSM 2782]|nr:hypothetical protein [Ruminiclostridium papyrosolvens]WES36663.1 hypothetical protein P0092_19430 [Ruminiclostridium papyrosolvens DSM 2782]